MKIFDLFKKNQTVVWREKNGNINCPGDACKKKCDETCPIWCQTLAFQYMDSGQDEKAINEFKKAIVLAPDFKDAWVNMAMVYGNMGNHLEANKAYKAAYAIDKKYKNAIFGLIVSCKNLGQFEEAYKYCDEYEEIVGLDAADKMRRDVRDVQNKGKVLRRETAIEMADKIVTHARKTGFLGANNHWPNIPEIIAQSKIVCAKLIPELLDKPNGDNPIIWFMWGTFAGIGAVYHWDIDWNNLKQKGIIQTLTEPRGIEEMDEYVLDSIGIKFDSEKGKEFYTNLKDLANWASAEFFKYDGKNMVDIALELTQSMYIFGMVYEMERLGMK